MLRSYSSECYVPCSRGQDPGLCLHLTGSRRLIANATPRADVLVWFVCDTGFAWEDSEVESLQLDRSRRMRDMLTCGTVA